MRRGDTRRWLAWLGVMMVFIAVAGCSGTPGAGRTPVASPSPSAGSAPPTSVGPAVTHLPRGARCPVTKPSDRPQAPPAEVVQWNGPSERSIRGGRPMGVTAASVSGPGT